MLLEGKLREAAANDEVNMIRQLMLREFPELAKHCPAEVWPYFNFHCVLSEADSHRSWSSTCDRACCAAYTIT